MWGGTHACYRGGSDTGRLAIPAPGVALNSGQLSTTVGSYLNRRLEALDEQFVETADIEVLRELEEVKVLLGGRPS